MGVGRCSLLWGRLGWVNVDREGLRSIHQMRGLGKDEDLFTFVCIKAGR